MSIDDVVEKKLAAVGGAALAVLRRRGQRRASSSFRPMTPEKRRRKNEVREQFTNRFAGSATRFRAKLRELYGTERGDAVKYAEAFEISEYGRRPNAEEIRRLFPFFGAAEQ